MKDSVRKYEKSSDTRYVKRVQITIAIMCQRNFSVGEPEGTLAQSSAGAIEGWYRCEESLYFRRAGDIKGPPAAAEESTLQRDVFVDEEFFDRAFMS